MMKKAVLQSDLINIDETPVQVLKEPGRIKSYMWVFKGTSRGRPVLLYHYDPSRSGDVAASFLNGYKGIVQTDGYSGYGFLDQKKDILHVGCWVHARRKFVEVTKAVSRKTKTPVSNAATALKYIGKLYKIEKTARASAAIYSLIETAKANGLEPYWCLKHLFENLPEAMSEEDFQALLPQQIDKDQIAVPTP
jgi:transposase